MALNQYEDPEYVKKLVTAFKAGLGDDWVIDLEPAEIVRVIIQFNRAGVALVHEDEMNELVTAWANYQQVTATAGRETDETVKVRRRA